MKPSGDGSRISEVVRTLLPKFNFARIGEELVDFLASQKQKLKTLSPDDLKALGLSALPQAARLLEQHAALDQLRTYAQALEAGVARKACRPAWLEWMLGEEQRSLDRASTAAINATVALRRLGQRVDTVRVKDWLRQLEQLFSEQDLARFPASGYVMDLRWVLFDAGDDSQLDTMLSENASWIRHDVAMSLLLRGDHGNLERWRQSIPAEYPDLIHPPFQVHYWPLIDYLQSLGLGHMSANGVGHALAREAGLPAPHGWVWRCVPED